MPLCHRVLLGKLTQQTTSGVKAVDVIVTNMTSNDTLWSDDNSSVLALNQLVNVTFHSTVSTVNWTGNGSADSSGPLANKVTAVNNSIFIKIVLLLILTAVVLLSTYKFVVRLFSGYSEKKDESSDYYIGIQDDFD